MSQTSTLSPQQLDALRREQGDFARQLATADPADFHALQAASLRALMLTLSCTKQVSVTRPRISQESERQVATYRAYSPNEMQHW